jgi:rhodanese-related sulfurtransferase
MEQREGGNLEIRPLDPYELRRALELGDPVTVLDVRSVQDYTGSDAEIWGSLRVVPEELERHVTQIPRGKQIVICSDTDRDGLAEKIAEALMRKGFNDVRPVKGGFQAYVMAGGPIAPRSHHK